MSGIFISYRREETIAYAGRLYDRLKAHFGSRQPVFIDVDTIRAGEDFVEAIQNTVASSTALIVVIGPQWITAADEEGRIRLESPKDFVHLEISTALAKNVPIIPILVAGARMPGAERLPKPLAPLSRRQAVELSDTSFNESIARLLGDLDAIINVKQKDGASTVESKMVSLARERIRRVGIVFRRRHCQLEGLGGHL